MLNISILDNGNLELTVDEIDREDFAYEVESYGYWTAMADAIEPYSCNGSFTHFDAANGNPFVGLTGAPCIAESMNINEDGDEYSIEGRAWYFDEYMLEDDAELLASGEAVVYRLIG